MALYDPRNKTVLETSDDDLYFWDGSGASWTKGVTISSTVSSVSDVIDLGAAQVFNNIPVSIRFSADTAFSMLSVHSSGYVAGGYRVPGIQVQDAADGSTFSTIGFVPIPCNTSFAVTVAGFNSMIYGVVSCRRYLRLKQGPGFEGGGVFRAWLRMGMQRPL